jgi:hypothetical protein
VASVKLALEDSGLNYSFRESAPSIVQTARILAHSHLALNIPRARASVFSGMIKSLVVAVAFASLLVVGCDQQPVAPTSGKPASSPPPATDSTPMATTSPLTPTRSPTREPQATPQSTPSAIPEASPTATPEPTPTATPETAPTPAVSPSVTPDAVKPSPTSSPLAANLDVRPTLSSQSANEYLRSYDDYITDFKSAYKAMKEGDMTKYQSVIQRARELQTKSEKLGGELNPEEEQQFADYLNKKANELAQFASQNR